MYNLRVWGKLTFPHYLGHTANQHTVLLVKKEGQKYVSAQPTEKNATNLKVSLSADWNIVCEQDKPIKIGEKFEHPFYAGIDYTITDILEVRECKGDWDNILNTPPPPFHKSQGNAKFILVK